MAVESKTTKLENSPSPVPSEKSVWGDHFAYLGFLLGMGFLCVQLGMLFAATNSPLYHVTRDGVTAARALFEEHELKSEKYPRCLWNPERQAERGVLQNSAGQTAPGLTVYTSGHEAAAFVVDMDGNEVHRWSAPFSSVWPHAPHLERSVPDHCIYLRRVHPFENGDILALYETPTTSPNGRGLAKLDLHGKPIWTFDACTHHDLNVGPDGRIYTLTQTIRTDPHPAFAYLKGPQIEEFVAILSDNGDLLQELSLMDLLGDSPYLRRIVTRTDSFGDILHSNTVSLIDGAFARHYPEIEAGDLMVCLRNLNLVIVINPAQEKIVWATSGPWHCPHDPSPLDDGRILIFDNCFTRGTDVISRVVEFDPRDSSIGWSFSEGNSLPLLSNIRSCQQRLPNGNTLITESDYGRILEVNPSGTVVWEYVNPVRAGDSDPLIPVISGAMRVSAEQLPFLNQTAQ